jgi:hypothetical protein
LTDAEQSSVENASCEDEDGDVDGGGGNGGGGNGGGGDGAAALEAGGGNESADGQYAGVAVSPGTLDRVVGSQHGHHC